MPIVVDSPGSLDALWERLKSPDFVLLSGDRYRELMRASAKGAAKDEPIVEAVTVRGRIDRRTADLNVEFRISNPTSGAAWVPIRLDGTVLSSALEADRIVPLRNNPAGRWEAEVQGAGPHLLRVTLTTWIATNGDDRRLDLAIPPAGATRLQLTLADDPTQVVISPGESIIPIRESSREGARIEAALAPRSRLDLRWRVSAEQVGFQPPLLGVQGDVAVDVSPDTLRTRSRWSITAMRGTATSLTVSIDPLDELLEVDLDGRAVAVQAGAAGEARIVTIPLPEPFRPEAAAHSLTLSCRRKIEGEAGKAVMIRGSRFNDSTLQGGSLAISQSGPIWVEGDSTRGLQRIDPAVELPSSLRARPGIVVAYRIVDRPYELSLRIEPSRPRIEYRADLALILLKRGSAVVDTRMSFRATRGRIFDLSFPIDDELEIEMPPADEFVEASYWTTTPVDAGGTRKSSRVLVVQLTPRARDSGTFALTLKSRLTVSEKASRLLVKWPWPSKTTGLGGRVAVVRTPGVDAKEPSESASGGGRAFSRIEAPSRDEWPWPLDRFIELDPSPIWLGYEGRPDSLALAVSEQKTAYQSETEVNAEIGRDGISYRESIRLEVAGGLLDEFELSVPSGIGQDWSIDGVEVAARYPVQIDPDGRTRHRVVLSRRGVRSISFVLRYVTLFPSLLEESTPRSGRFSWIRPVPEANGPTRFACVSSAGIRVKVDSEGWQEQTSPSASSDDGHAPVRIARPDAPDLLPEFHVTAERLLPLPDLVVSRVYLRTTRGPEELRTTASFRIESSGSSVVISLPTGSSWIGANLDGEATQEIERVSPDHYRVRLAAAPGRASHILCVESTAPAQHTSEWQPPSLVGAVVRETYWSVTLAGVSALLGTPSGWSDENHWGWTGYIWAKTPLRSEAELLDWCEADHQSAHQRNGGHLISSTNRHSYLFRRSGGSASLPLVIVPRSLLVVVCSGATAIVGMGLVLLRPRRRPVAVLCVGLLLMFAVAGDAGSTLQALFAGALGLLLSLVAAALQWAVDRRDVHRRPGDSLMYRRRRPHRTPAPRQLP